MEIEIADILFRVQSHGFNIISSEILGTAPAMVLLGVQVPVGRYAVENLGVFNPATFAKINILISIAVWT
jgi:hypothetical protein